MIPQILMICAGLLLPLSLFATEGDESSSARYIEKSLGGHFTGTRQISHMLLRFGLPASEQEWEGVYHLSEDGGNEQLVVGAEALNSYERTTFALLCRDPDTGLDQLIFTRSMGGTANGDMIDALFIYYDPQRKQFSTAEMNGQFVDASCSLNTSLKHARQVVEHGKMVEALQPPKQSKGRFASKALPDFSLKTMQAEKVRIDRMEAYLVWEEGKFARQGSWLHVKQLAEN